MAKNEVKSGKAYTAPKGRPTVHRNGQPQGRRMPSTVQWGLAILAFLIVLAVIFYIGRNFRTVGGNGALEAQVSGVGAMLQLVTRA